MARTGPLDARYRLGGGHGNHHVGQDRGLGRFRHGWAKAAIRSEHVDGSPAAVGIGLSEPDLADIDKIMAPAAPVTGPSPESV